MLVAGSVVKERRKRAYGLVWFEKKNEREVLGVIHNIIDIVTIYGRSVMEFGGGGGYGGKEKSLRKMKMEFYLGFGLLRWKD